MTNMVKPNKLVGTSTEVRTLVNYELRNYSSSHYGTPNY